MGIAVILVSRDRDEAVIRDFVVVPDFQDIQVTQD